MLLNPTLIVEIFSPSTEADDRGERISQDRCRVERFARRFDGQRLLLSATIRLAADGWNLMLAEVRDRVEFPFGNAVAPGSPADPPARQDLP